jgi:predicted HicB family RNase H-like nuclease
MKQKSKATRKTTMVRIDCDLKRRCKIAAAKRGISMLELSRLALEAYLSKPGA